MVTTLLAAIETYPITSGVILGALVGAIGFLIRWHFFKRKTTTGDTAVSSGRDIHVGAQVGDRAGRDMHKNNR